MIEFLRLLADRTRLEILENLNDGEKTSSELEEALNKAQSTISHQLKKLLEKDLIITTQVKEEESGKIINYYKIKNYSIFELLKNIEAFIKNKDLFDILL